MDGDKKKSLRSVSDGQWRVLGVSSVSVGVRGLLHDVGVGIIPASLVHGGPTRVHRSQGQLESVRSPGLLAKRDIGACEGLSSCVI